MKPAGTILRNMTCNSVYCLSPVVLCQISFPTISRFGMCAFHSTYQEGDWGIWDSEWEKHKGIWSVAALKDSNTQLSQKASETLYPLSAYIVLTSTIVLQDQNMALYVTSQILIKTNTSLENLPGNLPCEQLLTYCPTASGFCRADVSQLSSLIWNGPSWSLLLQDLKWPTVLTWITAPSLNRSSVLPPVEMATVAR